MPEPKENREENFSRKVAQMEKQKLKAQRKKKQSVWMGIGLFGIVGWTIASPTVLGALLGMWLDERFPQTFSWTLSLLISGLVMGCVMAWRWILMEHKEMNENDNNNE